MMVKTIHKTHPDYPATLITYLGDQAPASVFALGNLYILKEKMSALFCSMKCPGNLILQTFDLARAWRDAGVAIIGGFHSPMEKECLSFLLRGKQPIIWCPARSLPRKRLPKAYVEPLSEGRFLILSPFGESVVRSTRETARVRNEFVAIFADRIFVAYATPEGQTEAFCRKVITWGKPVLTFKCPENARLLAAGAHPYETLMTACRHKEA
jgi:predicted Rossmann fold nucleotide-binding protein DprA/Smf involved in DNA uptake